ncbi:hypothetical protein CES87_28120 [Pseudomonas sp. ERMR1:02]|nr:hypothetical protein CES87_28120 [Pseudomonas sp. ERMR1:02]
MLHGRPLKKANNGVHLNLGGHHRLKRMRQEGVLAGRLLLRFKKTSSSFHGHGRKLWVSAKPQG